MRINRPPLFFLSSLATVPVETYTKDYYDIHPIKAHFCSLLLPHVIRRVTQYHDNGRSFIATLLCSWKSLVEVAKRKKQSTHPNISSFWGPYSICFIIQSDSDTSAGKGVLLLFYVFSSLFHTPILAQSKGNKRKFIPLNYSLSCVSRCQIMHGCEMLIN